MSWGWFSFTVEESIIKVDFCTLLAKGVKNFQQVLPKDRIVLQKSKENNFFWKEQEDAFLNG